MNKKIALAAFGAVTAAAAVKTRGRSTIPTTIYDQPEEYSGLSAPASMFEKVTWMETTAPKAESRKFVLRQAHVFWRHGARTPLKPLSQDDQLDWDHCDQGQYDRMFVAVNLIKSDVEGFEIVSDQKMFQGGGSCRMGQLTAIGALQMYNLGQQLHRKYIQGGLVDAKFNARQVHVRSTAIERAIESARAALAGMYSEESRGNSPIDIHIRNFKRETLFINTAECPLLRQIFKVNRQAWLENDELIHVQNEMKKILNQEKVPDAIGLRDAIIARDTHGKPVPKEVDEELRKQIHRLAVWQVKTLVHGHGKERNSKALRLSIGRLIQGALDKMTEIMDESSQDPDSDSPPTPRLWLYSGHDTTLMPLLAALDVYDNHWPDFAAHVAMDLYQDIAVDSDSQGGYFVKICYNEKEMLLPGCSGIYCPFEEFRNAIDEILPKDFATECQIINGDEGDSRVGGEKFI